MTRGQAIARLRKLWGARATYRVGERLSSPDARASQLAARKQIAAAREAIRNVIDRRLAATDWYQELRAEERALTNELKTLDVLPYYRFTIGYRDRVLGFFHVEGQGDTWEQAFNAAERKRTPAATPAASPVPPSSAD
jgi:hypothetical protein